MENKNIPISQQVREMFIDLSKVPDISHLTIEQAILKIFKCKNGK
jgi:hypothetical protein